MKALRIVTALIVALALPAVAYPSDHSVPPVQTARSVQNQSDAGYWGRMISEIFGEDVAPKASDPGANNPSEFALQKDVAEKADDSEFYHPLKVIFESAGKTAKEINEKNDAVTAFALLTVLGIAVAASIATTANGM